MGVLRTSPFPYGLSPPIGAKALDSVSWMSPEYNTPSVWPPLAPTHIPAPSPSSGSSAVKLPDYSFWSMTWRCPLGWKPSGCTCCLRGPSCLPTHSSITVWLHALPLPGRWCECCPLHPGRFSSPPWTDLALRLTNPSPGKLPQLPKVKQGIPSSFSCNTCTSPLLALSLHRPPSLTQDSKLQSPGKIKLFLISHLAAKSGLHWHKTI